jgi:predicted transcriptional regulator
MTDTHTEALPARVHITLSADLRERLRLRAKLEDRTQRAVLERALRQALQES